MWAQPGTGGLCCSSPADQSSLPTEASVAFQGVWGAEQGRWGMGASRLGSALGISGGHQWTHQCLLPVCKLDFTGTLHRFLQERRPVARRG